MLNRSAIAAYTAVLLLLTAGVGRSAAPAAGSAARAPAPEVNACELLSTAEVSTILKADVHPGQRSDDGRTNLGSYSSTCFWRVSAHPDTAPAASGTQPLFAILNLMSWPAGSGMSGKFLQDFRDAEKKELIPGKTVPLKLGDEALSWGDGVAVRKGDISFGVSVALKPGDHAISGPMQEALARKVLEHMQRGDRPGQSTGI